MQQALDQVQNQPSQPYQPPRAMPNFAPQMNQGMPPPNMMPQMNSGMPAPNMMPQMNTGMAAPNMMPQMNYGMPAPNMMPQMNSGMPPNMMPQQNMMAAMNTGMPQQNMMPMMNSGMPSNMAVNMNTTQISQWNNDRVNQAPVNQSPMARIMQGMSGQRPGGILGLLRMANSSGPAYNPNDPQAQSQKQSAIDAVRYELSVSKSMASQAVSYMDRARYAHYRDEKKSAAYESRYYANEARAAAERAQSRGSGIPEAQGMISSAWAESDRAKSASDYANDAADDW